jgi:hypothetical protein
MLPVVASSEMIRCERSRSGPMGTDRADALASDILAKWVKVFSDSCAHSSVEIRKTQVVSTLFVPLHLLQGEIQLS